MFDIFAKTLSSIASFLFPLFASYKALKTSDPAQLTPWLMYWVVFACGLLVESWTEWILVWIPFYAYLRLLFLLYLVLPQTQGARFIYETYIHPWFEENENQIDDFIVSAHERLKAAGIAYLKQAIEYVKTNILGMPPTEEVDQAAVDPTQSGQSYTQALLSRFSVPAARWTANTSANAGADFYNLLAGAVSAIATPAGAGAGGAGAAPEGHRSVDPMSRSGTLIPQNLRDTPEKMTFIAAQRDRLNILLGALDREATELQREETLRQSHISERGGHRRVPSMTFDGEYGTDSEPSPPMRPASGLSGYSGMSKSRSEADFEKIDPDSGLEDNGNVRRRPAAGGGGVISSAGTYFPWGWGTGAESTGTASGYEKRD